MSVQIPASTGKKSELKDLLPRLKSASAAVMQELKKIIVGQEKAIDQVLTAMFAGGHCIILGALATAKTLLIGSIAQVMDLDSKRIQFTPDLMPSDISGTEILEEDPSSGRRVIKFAKGPVFTNILMADEINRTPPKTQAALLEVMQERQVTLGGRTYPLPEPFFVLATQISMEQEGTYPLPEAQQDRFMLTILMDYPDEAEEMAIVRQTTSADTVELNKVITGQDLMDFAQVVRMVTLPPELGTYLVNFVANSRPTIEGAPDFVKEYITWGAGLRASQNISLASKSIAARDGRDTVTIEDVRESLMPVLHHRISRSFRADIDHVTVEDIVRKLIEYTRFTQDDKRLESLPKTRGVLNQARPGT